MGSTGGQERKADAPGPAISSLQVGYQVANNNLAREEQAIHTLNQLFLTANGGLMVALGALPLSGAVMYMLAILGVSMNIAWFLTGARCRAYTSYWQAHLRYIESLLPPLKTFLLIPDFAKGQGIRLAGETVRIPRHAKIKVKIAYMFLSLLLALTWVVFLALKAGGILTMSSFKTP